jgi:hypothetical protein
MKSIQKPSPQLLDLLARCSPNVMHVALQLRELVLTEAPEAEEFLYSVYAEVIVFKFPGRKRGAFCNISAYLRHVNLVFFHGAKLPDPHRVLKGTGKQMRHIRFDSPEDLRRSYLRSYIRSAIELAGPACPSKSRETTSPPPSRQFRPAALDTVKRKVTFNRDMLVFLGRATQLPGDSSAEPCPWKGFSHLLW